MQGITVMALMTRVDAMKLLFQLPVFAVIIRSQSLRLCAAI